MPDYLGTEGMGADDFLEICVESLVGTVFEMRLSQRETIGNIKLRLQRLEGIPRQHMHLLHRASELPDGKSLEECGIETGATLRLILALRGGPINTRRVPVPSSSNTHHRHQMQQNQDGTMNIPDDVKELMSRNRDNILDKIPKNGQVCKWAFAAAELGLAHDFEYLFR
jgi:hypothetical protein